MENNNQTKNGVGNGKLNEDGWFEVELPDKIETVPPETKPTSNTENQDEDLLRLLRKVFKYSSATLICVVVMIALLMGRYWSSGRVTQLYDTLIVFQAVLTALPAMGQFIAIKKILKLRR